jgi:hypothetical protein
MKQLESKETRKIIHAAKKRGNMPATGNEDKEERDEKSHGMVTAKQRL